MAATAKVYDFDLGFSRVYDETVYPNDTSLVPQTERATVARLNAELLLPDNSILKVDMDFDNQSGYNGTATIVMDDDGAQMIADAFSFRYGDAAGQEILTKWHNRENKDDPRKPTFLFVKKPEKEGDMPKVFVACGSRNHRNINF